MNYLKFSYEDEPKIIGVRDGSRQSYFSEEFWLKNPLLKEYMWGKDITEYRLGIPPQNFDLNLSELDLNRNTKLTDLIDVALLKGCVVSEKLRNILQKAHLPKHNYYPVTFKQLDKKTKECKIIEGYWWLFFQKETGENTVNFERSKFDFTYHTKYLNLKESELSVLSI